LDEDESTGDRDVDRCLLLFEVVCCDCMVVELVLTPLLPLLLLLLLLLDLSLFLRLEEDDDEEDEEDDEDDDVPLALAGNSSPPPPTPFCVTVVLMAVDCDLPLLLDFSLPARGSPLTAVVAVAADEGAGPPLPEVLRLAVELLVLLPGGREGQASRVPLCVVLVAPCNRGEVDVFLPSL